MLCEKCRKNQATKSYERIKNGDNRIEYYCLDCYHASFVDGFDEETALTACPYCGTTAESVKKRNLVGCAECYTSLRAVLFPIVKKMQGGKVHTGKTPVGDERERVRRRCNELRQIIDKLNAEGNFDEARAYTERLTDLQKGAEREDFVWAKHRRLYKRS